VSLVKFMKCSSPEVRNVRKKYVLNKGKIVLFVGSLIKQKNVPSLLKAAVIVAVRHPETTFLICGEGRDRNNLEALSEKLGLKGNIFFLGNVPHTMLPSYYHACDLFVLPSHYEGLPKVLLEAALAKKPVIATNVTGSQDAVLDNVTGFLVHPDSHEELAEKIIQLLEDPSLARELGGNAEKHVLANFDPETNIRRIVDMWRKTIELAIDRGKRP
ncbi:MAG: glycosyltransferase, partial [Desulfobacteraceae bacterium]|nr:glycosyltransferase [Desulfobacteraceae bacterium]